MMRIAYRCVPGRGLPAWDWLLTPAAYRFNRHGYYKYTEAGANGATLLRWHLDAQRTQGYQYRQRTWPQSGASFRLHLVPHLFDSPDDRL